MSKAKKERNKIIKDLVAKGKSYREVARMFKISYERVRQIVDIDETLDSNKDV